MAAHLRSRIILTASHNEDKIDKLHRGITFVLITLLLSFLAGVAGQLVTMTSLKHMAVKQLLYSILLSV